VKVGDIRSLLAASANLALTYLKRSQPGDREQATELLHKAWRDADRLRIPEADKILGILKRNDLLRPEGTASEPLTNRPNEPGEPFFSA